VYAFADQPQSVAECRRGPVATVIENLEDLTVDEVIEQFEVTREQVEAVLEFVAESLRSEVRYSRASAAVESSIGPAQSF
jgi:hypothetical protein